MKEVEIFWVEAKMLENPMVIKVCQKLFDYANDRGLRGIKVQDLKFKKNEGPLKNRIGVYCIEDIKP